MRSKYFQLGLGIVLVLAGVVILAHSQTVQNKGWHRGGWSGARGMFLRHMARYLDLTDSQKAQIKSLWEAQRPAIQPLLQQLAAGRKDMLVATANGSFDQAKVQAIATQQAQTLAQLTVLREQLQSKIYNTVLNSDQRAKVDQLRQKRLGRLDQWLQKGTPKG